MNAGESIRNIVIAAFYNKFLSIWQKILKILLDIWYYDEKTVINAV